MVLALVRLCIPDADANGAGELPGFFENQIGVGQMKVTLQLGKEIGRVVELVDFGFPAEMSTVATHIAVKGLENVVKDTHAGITKKDNPDNFMELSAAQCDKKLDALRAGDLRTISSRIDVAATVEKAVKAAVTKLTFEEFMASKTPEEQEAFRAMLVATSKKK
jgi:hypothetical protein